MLYLARMKKRRAFTLLELIITTVLLSVVVLGGFAYFRYAKRYIAEIELRLQAINLARETMEELYWKTSAELDRGNYPDPLPAGIFPAYTANTSRQWTTVNSPDGRYRIITSTVRWQSTLE
jgi:prepilin-type N-terminal cleavage/methylation domain-containing protein